MADWKQNKAVGIAAGLLFVVAVVGFIFVLQPKKTKMYVMAKGSNDVLQMEVPAGAQFPIKNPNTGANDLYQADKVKCQKCGWEGYMISFFEPGKPNENVCPKCGAEKKNLLPVK